MSARIRSFNRPALWSRLACALASVPLSGAALAAQGVEQRSSPSAKWVRGSPCFQKAAARYHVDESLLRAIAKFESNYDPAAVHQNSDGTRDVGVMQINSSHFERLRRIDITEDTLFNQPCTNVAVGASILAGFIRQYGPIWRAVGAYGAGSSPTKEAARIAYAGSVSRALSKFNRALAPSAVVVAANAGPAKPQLASTPRMQVLD